MKTRCGLRTDLGQTEFYSLTITHSAKNGVCLDVAVKLACQQSRTVSRMGSFLARCACIAPLNRWPVAALWQVPQILAANNGRARFHPSPGILPKR
jgi:hypothetical protein